MKRFLIPCVVAILGASHPGIDAAGVEPSQNQTGAIGDVQLPYADMVRAYKNGQLDDARRLSRAHLVRSSEELRRARNDRDRASVVRTLLDIVHSMLAAENALPPQARLGGDLVLSRYVRDTLIQTRSVAVALIQVDPPVQSYIRREFGTTAQLWLRAGAAQIPRTELVAFYQGFQEELRGVRFATVDSALAEPIPIISSSDAVTASSADADKIVVLVRDYFEGFASGDAARLSSATGLGTARLSALMEERNEGYRRDGLRAVASVTVPNQPGLKLRPMPADGTSMYAFTIRGIVLDVVLLDGTRDARTIEKSFRARKDAAGRWTLVIAS